MRPPASTSARCVNIDGSRFLVARSASRARWAMYVGSVTTKTAPTCSLVIVAKAPSKSPRPAGPDRQKRQPQRPRCCLDVVQNERMGGASRVREDGHAPDLGDRFPEQLQVFAEDIRGDAVRHSGDVSAWTRETRNEPEPDRIRKTYADDGNRRRGALGRQGPRRRGGHNDIQLELNQLGRERGESVELPLRLSKLDDDVLTFHPAEIVEPLPERLCVRRVQGARGSEITQPVDFPGRLRAGGQRRGEEAACDRGDESA